MPGELHEDGTVDPAREIAAVLDAEAARLCPVDHQRGHVDGRQRRTEVALVDEPDDGHGAPGTGSLALVS